MRKGEGLEGMSQEEVLRPVPHQMDTAGTVWIAPEVVYRKISPEYREAALLFLKSALFDELVSKRLFPKTTVNETALARGDLVLEHERAPFILQAWEWSFSMLKAAALTILEVAELSEKHGYHLQDAHVFNVVFFSGRPMFVDFGSFRKGQANSDFLRREFLRYAYIPLVLWSQGDFYIANRLVRDHVPTRLQPFVRIDKTPFFHRYAKPFIRRRGVRCGMKTLANMMLWQVPRLRNHLLDTSAYGKIAYDFRKMEERIRSLKVPEGKTEWEAYHDSHFQSDSVTNRFQRIVEILGSCEWKTAVDLAGNGGYFTELLARRFPEARLLCLDYDSQAIDGAYVRSLKNDDLSRRVTVGMVNIMHPEGGAMGFEARIRSDMVLALAVTHHLILRQSADIDRVLESFCKVTNRYLAIEFMPLGLWDGKKTKPLPAWYTPEWFKAHLETHVRILWEEQLEPNRIFYLCEKWAVAEKGVSE